MTSIIYKMILSQYFKLPKFHGCWKLEFARLLMAGKENPPRWNLHTLNV